MVFVRFAHRQDARYPTLWGTTLRAANIILLFALSVRPIATASHGDACLLSPHVFVFLSPGDPARHQLDHRSRRAEASPLPFGVYVLQAGRRDQPQGTKRRKHAWHAQTRAWTRIGVRWRCTGCGGCLSNAPSAVAVSGSL